MRYLIDGAYHRQWAVAWRRVFACGGLSPGGGFSPAAGCRLAAGFRLRRAGCSPVAEPVEARMHGFTDLFLRGRCPQPPARALPLDPDSGHVPRRRPVRMPHS